jgi:hypothetical protein
MAYPDEKEAARVVTATSTIGPEYLTETERKIVAVGNRLVDEIQWTYRAVRVRCDPDAVAVATGDVLAVKPTLGPGDEILVAAATAARLAAGWFPVGIAVEPIALGSYGLAAVAGTIPPSITGLGTDAGLAAGSVDANGRIVRIVGEPILGDGQMLTGAILPSGALRVAVEVMPLLKYTPARVVQALEAQSIAVADVTVTNGVTSEYSSVAIASGGLSGGLTRRVYFATQLGVGPFTFNLLGMAIDGDYVVRLHNLAGLRTRGQTYSQCGREYLFTRVAGTLTMQASSAAPTALTTAGAGGIAIGFAVVGNQPQISLTGRAAEQWDYTIVAESQYVRGA